MNIFKVVFENVFNTNKNNINENNAVVVKIFRLCNIYMFYILVHLLNQHKMETISPRHEINRNWLDIRFHTLTMPILKDTSIYLIRS